MPLTPEERKARQAANWQRWYARNKEKQKARERARYHANRAAMTPEELEAFNARSRRNRRKTYAANIEIERARARAAYHTPEGKARSAARQKARWEDDPEFWRAYNRAARVRNLATHIAANLRWHANHPEAAVLAVNKRKARIAGAAINDVTPEQRELVIATANGRCAYCPHYNPTCKLCARGTHKGLTVDHITAIVNGGNNTLHNLVACCRSCNAKKSKNPNPIPVQPLLL